MTMAKAYKIDVNKKVKDLTKDERNTIFHGNSKEFKFKWTGDSFRTMEAGHMKEL